MIRWFASSRTRLAGVIVGLLAVIFAVGPVATDYIWQESSSHLVNLLLLLGLAFALLALGAAGATLVGDLAFPNRWRERVILGLRVPPPADADLDSPDTIRGMKTFMPQFSIIFALLTAATGFTFDRVADGFLTRYQRFGSLRTTLRSDDTAGKLDSIGRLSAERRENRVAPILEALDLTWRDPRQPDEVRSASIAAMGALVVYLTDAIDSWNADGRQDSWQRTHFADLRERLGPQLRAARETAPAARAVDLTYLLGLLRDTPSEPALIRDATDRQKVNTAIWRASVVALGRLRSFAAFEAIAPVAGWPDLTDESWSAVAWSTLALANAFHKARPELDESRLSDAEAKVLKDTIAIWAPQLITGSEARRCEAANVVKYLRDSRMRDPLIAAFDAPAGAAMVCKTLPVDVGLGKSAWTAEQGFFRRRLVDALALIALGDETIKAWVTKRLADSDDLDGSVKALLADFKRYL